MERSRRAFLAAGVASVAGLYAGSGAILDGSHSVTPQPPADTGEDGSRLWLRYASPGDSAARYRRTIAHLVVEGQSATAHIIRTEMAGALTRMLASPIPIVDRPTDGAVIVGTPANSAAIRAGGWDADVAKAGSEGYVIRTAMVGDRPAIVIASDGEIGALYGAFHFLRLVQTGYSSGTLDIVERPKVQ